MFINCISKITAVCIIGFPLVLSAIQSRMTIDYCVLSAIQSRMTIDYCVHEDQVESNVK